MLHMNSLMPFPTPGSNPHHATNTSNTKKHLGGHHAAWHAPTLDLSADWKKTPKFLGVHRSHTSYFLDVFLGLKSMTVSATNHDLLFSYPTSRNQPNKSNDLFLNFPYGWIKVDKSWEKTTVHHLFRFHVQESHRFFFSKKILRAFFFKQL